MTALPQSATTAMSKNKVVMEIQSETRSFRGGDAVKVMFGTAGTSMFTSMALRVHIPHADRRVSHGGS